MTKRKPKIKKLPRYDDGGVNPADPNRTKDGVFGSNGSVNTNNNWSSGDTNKAVKFSTEAANGVSRGMSGPGDQSQKYGNSANNVVDAGISTYTPWGEAAMTAQKAAKTFVPQKTVVDPESGKAYSQASNRTNQAFSDAFTPMHTTAINDFSSGNAEKGVEDILTGGVYNTLDNYFNGTNQKNFDDATNKNNAINKKNQDQQKAQQDQYNKMVNYYNQQNQSSQPQYSKGGKHKPKIHFVEPTQGNQMYNNAPQYPDDNHTFGDGGVSDGEPNSSIEKEEITVDPQDGSTYKSNSGTHESGNDDDVNLKPGTIILSDKLKPQGSKLTFAALAKPYQTTKEDRVLENDKISGNKKSTAELMKSIKNQKLNQLFQAQEQLKKSKVAEYARKIGVDINSLIQPNEEQGETTPDNEMQEHRYGGKQLPKYGNGLDDTNYINYDDSGNPITAQQQYGQVDDYHGMTRQPVPTMPVDPSVGQAPYYPDRSMKDDYVKESIYDEMGRKSIPPNQSNKINYKPYIGYAGTALSTAGAVYGLATNKQQPTVKPYLTNPRYLNADEALKSERENYLMNKKDFNEISGGNSSLAMSNLIRNKSKATSDRANILENVQNANASIYNRSDEFNIGQKLNADDINRRNQAAYRNMNTKYVGEIGDQLATGAKDYNSSGRDQDFLDFLDREYPGARQKYYKNKGQA